MLARQRDTHEGQQRNRPGQHDDGRHDREALHHEREAEGRPDQPPRAGLPHTPIEVTDRPDGAGGEGHIEHALTREAREIPVGILSAHEEHDPGHHCRRAAEHPVGQPCGQRDRHDPADRRRQAHGQFGRGDHRHRRRHEPEDQRRLVVEGVAVPDGCDPLTRAKHLARDLRIGRFVPVGEAVGAEVMEERPDGEKREARAKQRKLDMA